MRRFLSFFLFFLVVIVLPSVNSAPVSDLDLTLVNTPAEINKDLNFDATWQAGAGEDVNFLYWKFNSDGNVLDSNFSTADNNVFTDYFDGEDLNSPSWTIVTPTIINEDNQLHAKNTGAEAYSLLPQTWDLNSGVDFNFTFDANMANTSTTSASISVVLLNGASLADDTGYSFRIQTNGDGTLAIARRDVGSSINFVSDAGVGVEQNTYYRYTVQRQTDGDWQFFRKALDGSGDVNAYSVGNDSTYTDFNTVYLAFAGTGSSYALDTFDFNQLTNLGPSFSSLSSPQYQSHTFTSFGPKTVELTAQNVDGNTSTSLDFNITGSLDFTVWDENKGTTIEGATIDFNSGTYTTDNNGEVSIPLEGIASQEYSIIIDANADYTARTFVYDLNQFSSVDVNALLLEDKDGSNIAYTLKQPDESTLITNSIVEFRNTSTINNGIAGRPKTNLSAEVTNFVQQQDIANYTMRITDSVSNTTRDYNGTTITTKIPLDITNTSITLTPFSLEVGGLATQSYSGLTADQTFAIFSDTDDFYSFSVDANADYFGTTKLIRTSGGKATEEFQPYLVPQTGNLETTIYTINNPEGRITLPGIRVESYTNIGGSSVLVESKKSDGAGTALMHFESGRTYTLIFYDTDGVQIFSVEIEATATTYFAFIDLSEVTAPPSESSSITIEFYPSSGNATPEDGNITINQILKPHAFTIGDVNVFATYLNDSNVFFEQVFSVNSNQDFNLSYDINVSSVDTNNPIKVHVQVFDSLGNQVGETATNTYSLFPASTIFEDAKDQLGLFAVTLLALIITGILIGKASERNIDFQNANKLGFVAMMITGFFFLIGWIPVDDWFAAVFLGVGIILFEVKQ